MNCQDSRSGCWHVILEKSKKCLPVTNTNNPRLRYYYTSVPVLWDWKCPFIKTSIISLSDA